MRSSARAKGKEGKELKVIHKFNFTFNSKHMDGRMEDRADRSLVELVRFGSVSSTCHLQLELVVKGEKFLGFSCEAAQVFRVTLQRTVPFVVYIQQCSIVWTTTTTGSWWIGDDATGWYKITIKMEATN